MRTVAWLKAELSRFPDDSVCFAYEGEVTGIVIEPADGRHNHDWRQGVIHCSEGDDSSRATQLIGEDKCC